MVSGKMVRAAGLLSVNTFISRILGLVREMIFASLFGANYVTDAFRVAYAIPYVLRRLLGEGAMSAFLVPIFTDIRTKEGDEEGKRFVYSAYTTFSIVVAIIIAIGILIAPVIVLIIAPGFRNSPQTFNLTVNLTRIMFPYMFLMMTSAMSMGILNSYEHFFTPSLGPIVLNLGFIGTMLYLAPLFGEDISMQVYGLAYGVLLGGLLQVLVQVPAQFRFKIRFRPIFNFTHKGVKRMFVLMGPALIVIGVVRISLLLDNIAASLLGEGTISILNYSERLLQFPLGMIGFAVSTSSLPLLAKYYSEGKIDDMKRTLMDAFSLAMIVCLPAMTGLFALGGPIVSVIYRHGAFTFADAVATTNVLYALSVGLVGFIGVQIIVPAFYAMQDMKTPLWGAIIALVINGILNFTLMIPWGIVGIALATTFSTFANLILIAYLLHKRIGGLGFKNFIIKNIKILLISIVMAVVIYYSYKYLLIYLGVNILNQIIGLVVGVCVGILIYVGFAYMFRVSEISIVISRLLKRGRS
ncbi:MAG: murein biosynthesis integral membrane protein MurJ [bacterium]